MKRRKPANQIARRADTEIGWRELIGLPDLGIDQMRAKIDTGARTSALHAKVLKIVRRKGVRWVRFHVIASGRGPAGAPPAECMARLIDEREIRNTSGSSEKRLVVRTTLVLGDRRWCIDVSLADRENMGFDIILGRTAVRGHHLVVNPGRSYLIGPPFTVEARAS